jgi:hypothetical protein
MRETARLSSAGLTIVGVEMVSVRMAVSASARRRSIRAVAAGVRSRFVLMTTSAAINAFASVPNTTRTF